MWLLPFFPSPLKDDGYDISDYCDVHPSYGTLEDFRALVAEAHARGIRVLIELVVNHTSDQHPWFQAARRAPRGSREREFYVWSDTDQRFPETRIIFTDTEKSNWTYDAVAGQYYWHRFFAHQPDLNHNNPEVVSAVIDVMMFWLDLGVDALRLDAVPYLCVREGTTNENLPETHAVLKQMRRELDARYPDRMLLAEANQWPADVRPYFGDGDECQMGFHFPLMPRIFMAVRQEDKHPIVDILKQTPELPPSCQWALFLRNHDELTLEMVTDEERDYMYDAYAADPMMRLNVGIRRRLAPLMENSRRRVELLNVLLFTLPGTPVVYYGDEIGMGDNIYLGDRNGVRTPMQWSGDRNGGFSRADPARLFAPPIMDPVYGYQSINVEAQERYPFSLLNWMKRMIALRRQHSVLGRGALEFVGSANRKVLSYVRRDEHETVLVVGSLSRQAQPVSLELGEFEGLVPVEMMGEMEFPRIGDDTYPLSLGPYGYFLFRLEQNVISVAVRATAPEPVVAVESRPALLAGVAWDTLFDGALRRYLERDALLGFLEAQRWSGSARGELKAARFTDWGILRAGPQPVFLTLIEAERADGRRGHYLLPLATVTGADADRIAKTAPGQVLARITGARKGLLVDAVVDDRACDLLLEVLASSRSLAGQHGTIRAVRTEAWLPDDPATLHPIRRSATERPNSSIAYGKRKHLKLLRRLDAGPNPEIEIGNYLTRAGFTRVPPLVGWLEYHSAGGDHMALGLLQGLVHNEGETWERTLDELGRYFERVASGGALPPTGIADGSLLALARNEPPEPVLAAIGVPLTGAAVLGRRTAEMHLALGRETHDPAFAPEPLDDAALSAVSTAVQAQVQAVLVELEAAGDRLPEDTIPVADAVLRSGVSARVAPRVSRNGWGRAIRVHGDYHLAQVLWSEQDVIIVDFEGDPSRRIDERRRKASPLVDVATMVRSLGYATGIGLIAFTRQHPNPVAAPWAALWERWMAATFLRHYLATLGRSPLVPAAQEDLAALLDLFVIERAAGELRNELQNRPEWAHIPLAALARLQQNDSET